MIENPILSNFVHRATSDLIHIDVGILRDNFKVKRNLRFAKIMKDKCRNNRELSRTKVKPVVAENCGILS